MTTFKTIMIILGGLVALYLFVVVVVCIIFNDKNMEDDTF